MKTPETRFHFPIHTTYMYAPESNTEKVGKLSLVASAFAPEQEELFREALEVSRPWDHRGNSIGTSRRVERLSPANVPVLLKENQVTGQEVQLEDSTRAKQLKARSASPQHQLRILEVATAIEQEEGLKAHVEKLIGFYTQLELPFRTFWFFEDKGEIAVDRDIRNTKVEPIITQYEDAMEQYGLRLNDIQAIVVPQAESAEDMAIVMIDTERWEFNSEPRPRLKPVANFEHFFNNPNFGKK